MAGMTAMQARLACWRGSAVCASALAPAAQAQDFFSQLFGGLPAARARRISRCRSAMTTAPCRRSRRGRAMAVWRRPGLLRAHLRRTLFPDRRRRTTQSRAASCSSFCPASETKVVYGSNIDNAATENGKPYSELPNAFRYRNEIVAGCTCNGKDPVGLAPVKIEDDPTLRKGDIVAGENGLLVAGRSADRRGASLNFSPASERVRAKSSACRWWRGSEQNWCVSRLPGSSSGIERELSRADLAEELGDLIAEMLALRFQRLRGAA